MDYTLSNSYDTHVATGHRMHEDAKAIPTVWSAKDANSIIWSLMEIINAAGLAPIQFNANNPATYQLLLQAIRALTPRRLINIQVLTISGTFIRTAGAFAGRVRLWGAGAGGSGSVPTSSTQICVGRGGGSGAYGEHWFSELPSIQPYVIGAGGPGGAVNAAGGAGGATIFGSLIAPGAPATATPNAYVPPALESGGLGAAIATGCNLVNSSGVAAPHGQALNTSSLISGGGAPSTLGGGGNPLISSSGNGNNSPTRGAGGSGASNGASTNGSVGGSGGSGLIIVEEYA